MTVRATLACAGVLTLAGAMAVPAGAGQAAVRPFSVLQMNLCLSGYAGCFGGTQYPKVVDEAVAAIDRTSPDAITLNEACSKDAQRIAEETGYHLRFSTVIYNGAPLACKNPGGRGQFGNAILVRGAVRGVDEAPYVAQNGSEERRWMCVESVRGYRVCGTHLAVGSDPVTNTAQCHELKALLAESALPTVVGGDMNRLDTCAPDGWWMLSDDEATQSPGIQHVYGQADSFVRARDRVVPLQYSDHDALLVSATRR